MVVLKMETSKEIGCGKKLHYSIKSGCNRYCGQNLNCVLYLCKKCKERYKEEQAIQIQKEKKEAI
jgi:hypothetical protein